MGHPQIQNQRPGHQPEKTSRSVERKFHIDSRTVQKLRREMGDTEDRRFRKKLTAEQLEEARKQLASGARWRDVARKFNVVATTLLTNLKFRKYAPYRKFSREERKQILRAVARGEGKRSIAQRLNRPRSSIYLLLSRMRGKAATV